MMDEPRMSDGGDGKPAPPYTGQLDTQQPTLPGSRRPLKGKCGAKLRLSKPARYCTDHPTPGRKRCYRHGGKSLRGPDSGTFKHGLRSGYLPKGLKERYETARADQQLMKIREDVALVEAMLSNFTAKLQPERPLTVRQEARMANLVELRRKLIESEARRLKDLHQMITIERYLAQMTVVANVIRKHVTDDDLLTKIHADLQRHLMAPVKEGEDEG